MEATAFELFSIVCDAVLFSFLRIRQNVVQSGMDMVRKYHQNRESRYSDQIYKPLQKH